MKPQTLRNTVVEKRDKIVWRTENDIALMLRQSIASYAAADYPRKRVRQSRQQECGFDRKAWSEMADLGWPGILLDEDSGGSNMDFRSALTLATGFGEHLLPEPFVASGVIAATVVQSGRSDRARQLAAELIGGERILTLAWQEAVNQTGCARTATLLREAGDTLVLTGRKVFVPGWISDARVIVTARHGEGIALVVAQPSSTRISRMSDGTATAELSFEDVAVAREDVLLEGKEASDALDLALTRGTIAVCAQLEGLAQAALAATIDYMNKRSQFGQTLSEFQALRHKIVELHMEVELSGASWRTAADRLEDGGVSAARVSASAAKARCSQTALDVTRTALQYHGAFGYTDEADVGLYLNAALRLSSWLGNPLPHRRRAYDLTCEG